MESNNADPTTTTITDANDSAAVAESDPSNERDEGNADDEASATTRDSPSCTPASKPRSERLDYRDKVILAPMVRVGTLPMRLLALDYGADIVYSEEIVDRKLMECKRLYNSRLDTIEFYKGDQLVYQTCSRDTPTVIQLGAANAEGALQAANVV